MGPIVQSKFLMEHPMKNEGPSSFRLKLAKRTDGVKGNWMPLSTNKGSFWVVYDITEMIAPSIFHFEHV